MEPGKLWGLRRLADGGGRFKMLAVDQRPPIKNLIATKRGEDHATYTDVCEFKAMLVRELGPHSSAVLLDPHFAYPAAVHLVDPSQGLLLTLEDSIFEDTPDGRLSREIDHWSVEPDARGIGGRAVSAPASVFRWQATSLAEGPAGAAAAASVLPSLCAPTRATEALRYAGDGARSVGTGTVRQ